MKRALGLCCLWVAGFFCAPAAAADTVYTNQADWLAAVSALGDVRSLSLTPVAAVPDTGATYSDDEGTLYFPDNHQGLKVFADGWFGDVHGGRDDPKDHSPHENRFRFAAPVAAFAATVTIGEDISPEVDSLLLSLIPGQTHRLMAGDYSPGFFGWVGAMPGEELWIGSGAGSHFYSMTGVQYVVAPTGGVPGQIGTVPVPAPSPALGGLALLGMMLVNATRRSAGRRRSDAGAVA